MKDLDIREVLVQQFRLSHSAASVGIRPQSNTDGSKHKRDEKEAERPGGDSLGWLGKSDEQAQRKTWTSGASEIFFSWEIFLKQSRGDGPVNSKVEANESLSTPQILPSFYL